MDPLVLVAVIGLPANLLVAWATYKKASSADNAVNHRINGTTISQDILDIKVEQRELRKDVVWLVRGFGDHMRQHAERDMEQGQRGNRHEDDSI